MKLKGNYSIDESGRYIVIFEYENGEEWEVEFEIRIDKEYIYEETGRFLIDVFVQSKCLSHGFYINKWADMESELDEYVTNSFNL